MHLVGIQIQVPDRSVAGDTRDYCSIIRGSFRQEIPQRAGIPSPAGAAPPPWHTAPSAGNPKVFIKYFFVNAATGEKSGEKIVSAVLSNG